MRKLPTSFDAYELSEEELKANRFTKIQEALLQTKLSQIAEAKINLQFNGNNPIEFAQQEAYLAGKLDLLRELLTLTTTQEELQ